MGEARTPLGRVLMEIMNDRDIETFGQLGVRLKRAGYRRGLSQSVIGRWSRGDSKPQSAHKLCFYLDRALTLTDDEKQSVAAALGYSEYPQPHKVGGETTPTLHPHLRPINHYNYLVR